MSPMQLDHSDSVVNNKSSLNRPIKLVNPIPKLAPLLDGSKATASLYFLCDSDKLYITNSIAPIMDGSKVPFMITYIYDIECYIDFINNKIDKNKIIKILYPLLPIMTCENSVRRNDIWNDINKDCNDIYFSHACLSGVQYHNNAILNSKRVVVNIVNNTLK